MEVEEDEPDFLEEEQEEPKGMPYTHITLGSWLREFWLGLAFEHSLFRSSIE